MLYNAFMKRLAILVVLAGVVGCNKTLDDKPASIKRQETASQIAPPQYMPAKKEQWRFVGGFMFWDPLDSAQQSRMTIEPKSDWVLFCSERRIVDYPNRNGITGKPFININRMNFDTGSLIGNLYIDNVVGQQSIRHSRVYFPGKYTIWLHNASGPTMVVAFERLQVDSDFSDIKQYLSFDKKFAEFYDLRLKQRDLNIAIRDLESLSEELKRQSAQSLTQYQQRSKMKRMIYGGSEFARSGGTAVELH